MGFFSKVLKGLGFEDDKPQKPKATEQQNKNEVTYNIGAQYDLTTKNDEPKEKKQTQEFCPTSQVEVQKIVEFLREEDGAIVDLSKLSSQDYIRALDFLSGAIYVKCGKIQRLDGKKFMLLVNE